MQTGNAATSLYSLHGLPIYPKQNPLIVCTHGEAPTCCFWTIEACQPVTCTRETHFLGTKTCVLACFDLQSTSHVTSLTIQELQESRSPCVNRVRDEVPIPDPAAVPIPAPAGHDNNIMDISTVSRKDAAGCMGQLSSMFQGLAANCTITKLTLNKLQQRHILQLAAALTLGGCAGQLLQLNLPQARSASLPVACLWLRAWILLTDIRS